jgi:hypothetical protein
MRLMKRIVLLTLAVGAVVHAAVSAQTTLKVGVDLVNVLFTVTDAKRHLISGLTREDFLIEEDGRKQDIQFFSRESELPLTLGLLIDTSTGCFRPGTRRGRPISRASSSPEGSRNGDWVR